MNQVFAIDTHPPLLCQNSADRAFHRALRKILGFVGGRIA
jgi:hypothetical protein